MALELELVEIATSLDGRIPPEMKQKAREYFIRNRNRNIDVGTLRDFIRSYYSLKNETQTGEERHQG